MRSVVTPLVVATCLLAAAIPRLHAQVESREGIALQNEIYQLRQELKSVEDQVGRGGGSNLRVPAYAPPQQQNSDLLTQLLTRVDALEDQVRQLRGRIDETQNQLQQQNADLNKRIDDLAFQINPRAAQPGTSPPAFSNPGPPATPTAARPASPPASRTPEVALHEGDAALGRRDYTAAEADAREVLANRTSPRAYDARLLLAQSLYGQRQYAQSAIAFDDAYNSSRKGSHAPEALVGLASSLSAINEKKAACDTLARLHADFPQLKPNVAAGAAAAAQRAGCH